MGTQRYMTSESQEPWMHLLAARTSVCLDVSHRMATPVFAPLALKQMCSELV
jgi:hypothetical protein